MKEKITMPDEPILIAGNKSHGALSMISAVNNSNLNSGGAVVDGGMLAT